MDTRFLHLLILFTAVSALSCQRKFQDDTMDRINALALQGDVKQAIAALGKG